MSPTAKPTICKRQYQWTYISPGRQSKRHIISSVVSSNTSTWTSLRSQTYSTSLDITWHHSKNLPHFHKTSTTTINHVQVSLNCYYYYFRSTEFTHLAVNISRRIQLQRFSKVYFTTCQVSSTHHGYYYLMDEIYILNERSMRAVKNRIIYCNNFHIKV